MTLILCEKPVFGEYKIVLEIWPRFSGSQKNSHFFDSRILGSHGFLIASEHVILTFWILLGGGGQNLFFFCYANFSIVLAQNFKGAEVFKVVSGGADAPCRRRQVILSISSCLRTKSLRLILTVSLIETKAPSFIDSNISVETKRLTNCINSMSAVEV